MARQLAWSQCSQSPHDETVVAWDRARLGALGGWAGEKVARNGDTPAASLDTGKD